MGSRTLDLAKPWPLSLSVIISGFFNVSSFEQAGSHTAHPFSCRTGSSWRSWSDFILQQRITQDLRRLTPGNRDSSERNEVEFLHSHGFGPGPKQVRRNIQDNGRRWTANRVNIDIAPLPRKRVGRPTPRDLEFPIPDFLDFFNFFSTCSFFASFSLTFLISFFFSECQCGSIIVFYCSLYPYISKMAVVI